MGGPETHINYANGIDADEGLFERNRYAGMQTEIINSARIDMTVMKSRRSKSDFGNNWFIHAGGWTTLLNLGRGGGCTCQ